MRERHKYGAKATVVDGIRFASQKEAQRYAELKLLEKSGDVKGIELQPSFDLYVDDLSLGARLRRAAANLQGKSSVIRTKIGTYRADFRYQMRVLSASDNQLWQWHVVIEDVKGFKTPLYRWKKKHVEAQYRIQIIES